MDTEIQGPVQGPLQSLNEGLLNVLDCKRMDEQRMDEDFVEVHSDDSDSEGKAEKPQEVNTNLPTTSEPGNVATTLDSVLGTSVEGLEAIVLPKSQDKMKQDKGKNKVGTPGNAKEWVELFKNNRTPSHCVALHKVENQGKAGTCKLDAKDLIPLEKAWGSALIGFFAGKNPGSWCLNHLVKSWKVKVKHHYHTTGWIVFQFQDDHDMMKILDGGPYFAGYQPLILKHMPELFRFDDVVMRTMPVWVTLSSLPKECWGVDSMSKIVSLLGDPMRLDMRTSTLDAVSYARALVLVDASTDLLFKVTVEIEGKSSFEQEVIYDYIPTFCTLCNTIGHKKGKCHLKGKSVAADKGKVQTQKLANPLPLSEGNERVDKLDKQDASKGPVDTEVLMLGDMPVDGINCNLVNGESSTSGMIVQELDLDNRFAALTENLGNIGTPSEALDNNPLATLTGDDKFILDQNLDKATASSDDPGITGTLVLDASKVMTVSATKPDLPKGQPGHTKPPVSGTTINILVSAKAKKGILTDSATKRVTRQEMKGTNKKQFIGSYQPPNKK